MKTKTKRKTWPDQYLHVTESNSGETWVVPIDDNTPLDLTALVSEWCKSEFGGELQLDGGFMRGIAGDYYAQILTDNRSPESGVVWTSGGFYLKRNDTTPL